MLHLDDTGVSFIQTCTFRILFTSETQFYGSDLKKCLHKTRVSFRGTVVFDKSARFLRTLRASAFFFSASCPRIRLFVRRKMSVLRRVSGCYASSSECRRYLADVASSVFPSKRSVAASAFRISSKISRVRFTLWVHSIALCILFIYFIYIINLSILILVKIRYLMLLSSMDTLQAQVQF